MQVTFIGHASILIESHGLRILSDPWWRGPCFGAQWWIYPSPCLAPLELPIDFIYVSHGHHDHFHPGTLRTLNRDAKVLVSKNIDIAEPIRELGFEVIEIDNTEEHSLAHGLKCRIIETHGGDTLLAVSDGNSVCVNLNDALHAAADDVQTRFIALLKTYYPTIDYLFCGYGVASHFPNCYRIPGKDSAATAARRQAYFNRRWARIASELNPRFAFPFAADVVFLEHDLMWMNEPTHNSERPTDVFKAAFPHSSTVVMDIAPGFQIVDGIVTQPIYRRALSISQLRSDCAEKLTRANEYGSGSDAVFEEVLKLVRENTQRCNRYLLEYSGDYRFLLRFRNHRKAIAIVKRGTRLSVESEVNPDPSGYDVTYTTRLQYIKWSLSSEYGHEILFVGSGGVFEYRSRAKAQANVHRELMVMLVPHATPPKSRYGAQRRWSYSLKKRIKALLGRAPADLYDLDAWTVWSSSPEKS